MKLYWQLTRYLRQRDALQVIPKGAIIAFGENDIGIVHPGTDGQAPVYDSTSPVGLTAGTVTGGPGGTTFDQLAPAATAKGQLIISSGPGAWAARAAPPGDAHVLVSSNIAPLGWTMRAANLNNLPSTTEKAALAGSGPGVPGGTNKYITEDAIGSDIQAWDADLDAISAVSGTGFLVRTGTHTYTTRTLTAGAGITITDADGVAGSPTIAATVGSTTGGTGGGGPGFEALREADLGRINVAVLSAGAVDPELTIGSLAAGLYEVKAHLLYRGHATPDFAAGLSHTALAGVTLAYVWEQSAVGVRPVLMVAGTSVTQTTATPTGAFPNDSRWTSFHGTLQIHPGLTSDLYVHWGQAQPSATLATTMHRGSFLRAIPLVLY